MSQRKYKSSDVGMITTCSILMENAIASKAYLVTKRPSWEGPIFDELRDRVLLVSKEVLGIDNLEALRNQTRLVTGIQDAALADLSEMKVQLQTDFSKEKPRLVELLTKLGFKQYHERARRKNQQALVQLLFQFSKNLEPEVHAEIAGHGTDGVLLDRITAYADTFVKANITQETFKGGHKELTAAAVGKLNDIYNDVIRVAKVAHNFYKGQPTMQEQFSYVKILKHMSNAPKKEEVRGEREEVRGKR